MKKKPDNAEELAQQAYAVWVGLRQPNNVDPPWEKLDHSSKALLEWVARWTLLQNT